MLTGSDATADAALRREHFFASAPSVNLATALLDLCAHRRAAARACLDVCHQLSAWLSAALVAQHLLVLNLIKQLLFYAKLQFSRQALDEPVPEGTWTVPDDGGAEGGVAVCQTFLAHVDLLHDLYVEDCGVTATLEDLADGRRARALRDRLVQLDRMRLAHAVAMQCSVEREPVWLAWGLALLRRGEYDGAKDKIAKCLERTPGASAGGGVSHLVDRGAMLEQILDVLQQPRRADSHALRAELNALQDELAALPRGPDGADAADTHVFAQPPRSSAPPLDTVRYMQCMYYLSRLGSPTRLLRFWLGHGHLEDAVRYVVLGDLPEDLFISEVGPSSCGAFWTLTVVCADSDALPFVQRAVGFVCMLAARRAQGHAQTALPRARGQVPQRGPRL